MSDKRLRVNISKELEILHSLTETEAEAHDIMVDAQAYRDASASRKFVEQAAQAVALFEARSMVYEAARQLVKDQTRKIAEAFKSAQDKVEL
jgi:hypothetical protein